MGYFTTLIYQDTPYQFKTGHDDLMQTVRLGDKLEWEPDPYWPGSHPDGVHDAICVGDRPSLWVVVRHCRVVAVGEIDEGTDFAKLAIEYNVTDPPRNLWTEEQWAAAEARRVEANAKYEEWRKKHGYPDPVSYFIYCSMRETSFASRVLPVKKVKGDE